MRYSKLIAHLNECAIQCNRCVDACIDSGDLAAIRDCMRANLVCAEICRATARILGVTFTDVGDLIKYCHRICTYCASECEKHSAQHFKACAEACKKCASACKAELVKYETKLTTP